MVTVAQVTIINNGEIWRVTLLLYSYVRAIQTIVRITLFSLFSCPFPSPTLFIMTPMPVDANDVGGVVVVGVFLSVEEVLKIVL